MPQVRDLIGVVEREKAAMGLFISLESPTAPMRREAAGGGIYHSDRWDYDYPKIQIRTIEEMLAGNSFELPRSEPSHRPAQRVRHTQGMQAPMDGLDAA